MTVSATVGYNQTPDWTHQWHIVQRHLSRLREMYQGTDTRGNIEVEDTVKALLVALNHLADWLFKDPATGLTKRVTMAYIGSRPASLGLCRAFANTLKHKERDSGSQQVSRIASIEMGQSVKATIVYGRQNQLPATYATTDALALAQQSEQHWRDFLNAHGIQIPA